MGFAMDICMVFPRAFSTDVDEFIGNVSREQASTQPWRDEGQEGPHGIVARPATRATIAVTIAVSGVPNPRAAERSSQQAHLYGHERDSSGPETPVGGRPGDAGTRS